MIDAVVRLDSNNRLSSVEEAQLLDELESQECWRPIFRYLERILRAQQVDVLDSYSRFIRIKLRYFHDISTASVLVGDMIRQTKMSFAEFREQILSDQIIPENNPQFEIALLEVAAAVFYQETDRIQALERIAMIFEKRLFNDAKLHDVFERILKLDANNVRALRHFKLAFSQNGDWGEVVVILKKLIQITKSQQERFRLAHDLAHCLVYNMKQPRDALLVIDKYCKGTPLDISQVEYDAASRVGDTTRCIRVLDQLHQSIRDDAGRAVINFRLAGIYRANGRLDECESRLRLCLQYWPVFLDPIEHLIEIYLEKKRWLEVRELLRDLTSKIADKELAGQVHHAIRRITNERIRD